MSRWPAVLVVGMALLAPLPAPARDLGSLYDDASLSEWRSRYQDGVLRNYEEVVLPRLTDEERRALAGVVFAFPLRGPQRDPFEFYATHPPPTVNLPVLSLKFFDDFSVALAWLDRNSYGLDTAYEYLTMLKYADTGQFGGRYPPPLEALQIPADALQNPAVANLAEKIFDSAIAFVMLHELGHIRYRHPGNGPEVPSDVSRANEEAADAFALEIMRRAESDPAGMSFLFLAFAYGTTDRGDFGSDADYAAFLHHATHPLTEARIRALTQKLSDAADDFARNDPDPAAGRRKIEFIVQQLSLVSDILADPDAQRLIDRIGRTTTLAMLAPRRPGQTQPTLQNTDAGLPSGPFAGSYKGEIGLPDGKVSITTLLKRQGDRVMGEYFYGTGRGTLVGIVDQGTLVFQWQESTETGHGSFRLDSDDRGFVGTWGFEESDSNGGSWTGEPAN